MLTVFPKKKGIYNTCISPQEQKGIKEDNRWIQGCKYGFLDTHTGLIGLVRIETLQKANYAENRKLMMKTLLGI
jgi:hypothetical protein